MYDLLGISQGFRSSPSSASLAAPPLEIVRQVDAKYPALLFKQQLTAYVEKIYGIVRDNLKKELASLLSLCIQVCGTSICISYNTSSLSLEIVNFRLLKFAFF